VPESTLHDPPPHDPAAVREATEALLAEARYREGMKLRQDGEVDRFLDVLWARIVSWVAALIHLQETHPVLYWLLLLGLIVVAVAMVWHITYSVRRSSRPQGERKFVVGDVVGEGDLASLRQRFDTALQEGDLARALRLRFALAVAERIGMARLRSLGHLTYRELLQLVSRADPVPGLASAVGVIEETLYAGRELDTEAFHRCVDGIDRPEAP